MRKISIETCNEGWRSEVGVVRAPADLRPKYSPDKKRILLFADAEDGQGAVAWIGRDSEGA